MERKKDNFTRNVKVIEVVDGDTIKIMSDGGYNGFTKATIRLLDINTAETKSKTAFSKMMADKAEAFVKEKILNKEVIVESYKFKDGGFGRYLGIVYYDDENGQQVNLNQQLLDLGLARTYTKGASKIEWTEGD